MGVKGDKWRGGWTPRYEENHNRIFNKKKENIKMSEETTAQTFLDMYLSEQIPESAWQIILGERVDVRELYQKHLEKRNVGH